MSDLTDVRVEGKQGRSSPETRVHRPRPAELRVDVREARKPPRENQFVYVNSAYTGSVDCVNDRRPRELVEPPITGVYREQYWACSRWPYTQRVLAITVGVLLGALIGLVLSFVLKDDDDNLIAGIFRSSGSSVPD